MGDNSAAQDVEDDSSSNPDVAESGKSSRKSSADGFMSKLPIQNGISVPVMPLDPAHYQIHKAVYENNFRLLTKLIRQKETDLERKDMHGNPGLACFSDVVRFCGVVLSGCVHIIDA